MQRQRGPPLRRGRCARVTGANTLKDKTAVVGVGATPYYKRGESLPQTPMELAGKAVIAALDDAGLTVDDLDGFALYSMGFDTSLFAQWLGVPDVRFTAHAHRRRRRRGGSVGLASAAIVSGMAECVVSVMTLQQAASRFGASFAPRGSAGRGLLRRRRRPRATSSSRRG